eukprot:TRINITY_DN765_c0_g1_i1.p1 TRINITY_DN765_c0_g1~~TRINITY_DN765_c0_g1_i1.p1  ORF type:complete len:116 (+),score=36.02 TRINITY_DN765_c0_g1_i1:118-465(+)
MSDLAKKIRIQSGVVKRTLKEWEMYRQEVIRERDRLGQLKQKGADEYDIRKQEEVVQESLMMIPDSKQRLEEGSADLSRILSRVKPDSSVALTEEYTQALEIQEQATEAINSHSE